MRVALLVLLLAAVWADGAGYNQSAVADCEPLTLDNVMLTSLPQAVVQVAEELDMEPNGDPREMLLQHSSEAVVAAISRRRQTTIAYLDESSDIQQYVLPLNRNMVHEQWRNLLESIPQDSDGSWSSPFLDCLTGKWLFGYITSLPGGAAGIFFPLERLNIDRCNESFSPVFGGSHNCDHESAQCIPAEGDGYTCSCRPGFFLPSHTHQIYKCRPCPEGCAVCGSPDAPCMASYDYLLRTAVLGVQILCMSATVVLAVVVFKQRKCKTIASGMWTILETILLGTLLLYSTVVVRFFEPSVEQCLVEPWCRELGFVICYGAIILKLYRILIEFRTRKAHRWVVRDKDLLKYLLGMVIVVFGYMAAWTATNLNFIQENYNVLTMGTTYEGLQFLACKALWWDYVTETGEILILVFGIHLSYACRNASTQFQERRFLCLAIVVEATVSGTFYILRIIYSSSLHPDYSFLAYFCRSQLTSTVVLLVIFTPKLWYQHKQVRDSRSTRHYLPHEYSCRLPVDAFKPQDGITGTNSSDVDVGEINLADMNPEDIRAELKRLYTQLEVLKNKTIRADNPHISKRRGGRKVAHRRFSLQALHHRHQRCSMRHHGVTGNDGRGHGQDHDAAEAEVSRTPEDSVCSLEGPSAIYNDGPSTYSEYGTPYRKQ